MYTYMANRQLFQPKTHVPVFIFINDVRDILCVFDVQNGMRLLRGKNCCTNTQRVITNDM